MKPLKLTILLFIAFQFAQSQNLVWEDITPKDYYLNHDSYGEQTALYMNASKATCDGRILLATVDGKIAESSDTGKTWQVTHYMVEYDKNAAIHARSLESFELKQLEFADNKTNGIYSGIYVYKPDSQPIERTQIIRYTPDGGKTWLVPQTDFSDKEVIHVCWKTNDTVFASVKNHSTRETYIYRSADAGNNWEKMSENLLLKPSAGVPLAYYVAFVNDTLGYALGWLGYNVTTDGGNTWSTRIAHEDLQPHGVMRFSNGEILLAGEKNIFDIGIAHCKYKKLHPITSAYTWDPYFIKDMGDGVVYANAREGLIMSVDSGHTWNWHDVKASYNYFIFDKDVHVGICGYTTEVSTDGGLTWTTYYERGIAKIKNIYAKTEDEYYIFGDYAREFSRIFRTTDRGKTWTYTDVTSIWGKIQSLKIMQFVSPDTAYISAEANIHRSIDGGETWQTFRLIGSGDYLQFLTPDIGYSGPGSYGSMFKTTNGGETWASAEGNFTDETYADYEATGYASFKTIDEGLVGGNTGLLYTNNGGYGWQYKDVGFTGTCYSARDNWIITDREYGNIYICDADFNCSKTYEIQGFDKWTERVENMLRLDEKTLVIPFVCLTWCDDHSKDSALVSSNNGLSWKMQYFPHPFEYNNIMVLNKYTLYAAARGNIYKGVYTYEITNSNFIFNATTNTVECLITTEADEEFTAAILLVTSSGDTTVLVHNQTIQSNRAFSVAVPQVSENFSIVVQPTYSKVFETLTSQTLTPTTAIESVEPSDIHITVVNNIIHCNCKQYRIINTVGQEMPKNQALTAGVYVVECNNELHKVLVQ